MSEEPPKWYSDTELLNAITAVGEVMDRDQILILIHHNPEDEILVLKNGEPVADTDLKRLTYAGSRQKHMTGVVRMAVDGLKTALSVFSSRVVEGFDCTWAFYPVFAYAEGEAYRNDRPYPRDMSFGEIVAQVIKAREEKLGQ